MSESSSHESFYEVLEVGPNASFEAIEDSYQRIVSYLDTGSLAIYSLFDEEDVTRMRSSLDEAYRTLSDPDRRAAYDRSLSDGAESYPPLVVTRPATDVSSSVGLVATGSDEKTDALLVADAPPSPASETKPKSTVTESIQPEPNGTKLRRVVPTLDFEITDETEFSGALLKRLRESADATLEDVAEITKISKRYLKAIEENDFSGLPAAVYVRGFVREYARAMGLSSLAVANSYMALYDRFKEEGE